jgi:hypothetical protein
MVRKLNIVFAEPYNEQDFELENTTIINKDNNQLEMNVYGDINPLIKTISKYKIQNIVFPEPSLEDTFLAFYNQEDNSA